MARGAEIVALTGINLQITEHCEFSQLHKMMLVPWRCSGSTGPLAAEMSANHLCCIIVVLCCSLLVFVGLFDLEGFLQ
jgi:hypothetical protein